MLTRALLAVVLAASAALAQTRPSTLTGDLRLHEQFPSKHLGNARTIRVLLPAGYDRDAAARYPVLYMHDGQNLFDSATGFAGEWGIDETIARLVDQGLIRPIIVVGIDNAGEARIDEMADTRMPEGNPFPGRGGRGGEYGRFVVEEVKPLIDATYRTLPGRQHTAVAGSSLGANISLQIARDHPGFASRVAAISPALWWNAGSLLASLHADRAWTRDTRFYVDMGSAEGEGNLAFVRRMPVLLGQSGLRPGTDFVYAEIPGAAHNEAAWAARAGDWIVFFFGTGR